MNYNFEGNFNPCMCKNKQCPCGGGLHSYVESFKQILYIIKPKSCFEWGPGKNTNICLDLDMIVHSKEFDRRWVFKNANRYKKFTSEIIGYNADEWKDIKDSSFWDVFFVDSRNRQDCIKNIFKYSREDSIMFLHDAQRQRYHESLSLFPYVYFTIKGFCFATKSKIIFDKIKNNLI